MSWGGESSLPHDIGCELDQARSVVAILLEATIGLGVQHPASTFAGTVIVVVILARGTAHSSTATAGAASRTSALFFQLFAKFVDARFDFVENTDRAADHAAIAGSATAATSSAATAPTTIATAAPAPTVAASTTAAATAAAATAPAATTSAAAVVVVRGKATLTIALTIARPGTGIRASRVRPPFALIFIFIVVVVVVGNEPAMLISFLSP